MGRLDTQTWERARAEYEVRGISLGEVAKRFGVNISTVSRRAKADGWIQGKLQPLAEQKVAAVKALHDYKAKTQDLPVTFQLTLEDVARTRLQADEALAALDVALANKTREMLARTDDPEVVETLSRARKNIAPTSAKGAETTVNVNQQQAQEQQGARVQPLSPRDALAELVRRSRAAEAEAEAEEQ